MSFFSFEEGARTVHEFYGPIEHDFASALGQMVWSAMRVEGMAVRTCQALNIAYRPGLEIGVAIIEATQSLRGTSEFSEVDAAMWLHQAGIALQTRDAIVHASVTASMTANGNTVDAYYFQNRRWDAEGILIDDEFHALTVDALEELRANFDELARRWTHVDGTLGVRGQGTAPQLDRDESMRDTTAEH